MSDAYMLKIRGGCEVDSKGKRAGKGALISKEMSMTLSVTQDQYLFQPIRDEFMNDIISIDRSAFNQGKNAKFNAPIDRGGVQLKR